MRKIRNVVAGILCIMLLITSAVTVNAASPYAVVVQCTECATGTVYKTTTRTYQHNEKFTCSHGGTGKDTYAVYKVTVIEDCNSCSYSTTYSYEDHVLTYCPAN